jgi:8-oxo-dGTP diphosphatase
MITITASVILRNNANEILFVKEGKSLSYGLWNLPGGRFNENENAIQCAIREAKEETGHTVQLENLLGVYNFLSYSKYELIRFVFNASILEVGELIDNTEILELRWISLATFSQFNNNELLAPEHLRKVILDSENNMQFPLSVLR